SEPGKVSFPHILQTLQSHSHIPDTLTHSKHTHTLQSHSHTPVTLTHSNHTHTLQTHSHTPDTLTHPRHTQLFTSTCKANELHTVPHTPNFKRITKQDAPARRLNH